MTYDYYDAHPILLQMPQIPPCPARHQGPCATSCPTPPPLGHPVRRTQKKMPQQGIRQGGSQGTQKRGVKKIHPEKSSKNISRPSVGPKMPGGPPPGGGVRQAHPPTPPPGPHVFFRLPLGRERKRRGTRKRMLNPNARGNLTGINDGASRTSAVEKNIRKFSVNDSNVVEKYAERHGRLTTLS